MIMDLNKQKIRNPREYAAKKLPDFTDVTILSSPLPQATSTVDRKTMMKEKINKSNLEEQKYKHRHQLNFDWTTASNNSEESLGIIQNISSLLDDKAFDNSVVNKDCSERERELARNLLKKCSNPVMITFPKDDKENDVNSSNLMKLSNAYEHPPNLKNIQCELTNPVSNLCGFTQRNDQSSSINSIIFEPTEISARSSELNKTSDKSLFSHQDFSAISYNSNLGEMMIQFGDEEFLSDSKVATQLLMDEMSRRKDKFISFSIENNVDKNRLELSCFSGVLGGNDLTIDEGKVSIGEFFKKKCGGTGHLSTASMTDRPSFGLDVKSPLRQGKLQPLIDNTITTEESFPEERESKNDDCSKEPSVMSLNSIAYILENIDSATPRKLVDQILEANKKKRKLRVENSNSAGNTYTLIPSNRISLPTTTFIKDKTARNKTESSFVNKLSLDSKTTSELGNKSFNDRLDQANFLEPNLHKLFKKNPDVMQEEDRFVDSVNEYQLINRQNYQRSQTPSIPRAENSIIPTPKQLSQLSHSYNKFTNSTSVNNETSLIHSTGSSNISDITMTKNDSLLKEDTLTNSYIKNQFCQTKKLEIGKRTQELCTCLIGIPKEVDFELYNGTDRWILCGLKLYQIQGEKDNIVLTLPDDNMLIEPDARKSFKIGVVMPRMGKLTIAILHIPCSDMVTRSSWFIKHLMCFVPEELSIKISTVLENNTMNFQTITENTCTSLSLTLENENSIDVPILLYLNQAKPQLFSIVDVLHETVTSLGTYKESLNVILKPKQSLTVNIDFKGISLQSFEEEIVKNSVYNAEAKLQISVCFNENKEYLIKEIFLKGAIGSCKLDIVDTLFPLVIQYKVDRIITLKNSGSITVSATIDIVQSKENQNESREFFICPNNIVLNSEEKLDLQISYKPEFIKTENEKYAMIRIVVGNKVSYYPIFGEKVSETDLFPADAFHQLQRSETPQCLRSISSPSSPHSLTFNRSANSGRHSPGSTASTGTAIGVIIPLRATHTSLVWGSVKIGKSDIKQFTIRNTSNSKVKLLVTIRAEDQNFKLLKNRQLMASAMNVSLQGMESKTLSVVFTPNSPRAAAGKIIFSHYSTTRDGHEIRGPEKKVQLFGYGGYGKVEIYEAVKDTSGQMWLSLGKLNSEVLHAKIKLYNTGDLTCFAKLKLVPKALYPSVISSWHVEPSELLLPPNQIQWILLEFRPKKDDIITQQTGVIHVGTLKIIHGDEPTRLRIRRLYKKLKDSGQLCGKINEQADEFKEVIERISKAFPGEIFTKDLKLIGDSVQNLGDLCKGIVQNEVKLTIEIHADETISILQDNMEDSQVFYSLCSDYGNQSHFGTESYLPID